MDGTAHPWICSFLIYFIQTSILSREFRMIQDKGGYINAPAIQATNVANLS